MKFRYYFLSFTLAMLAIYGLHFAYVYYFVENPYADVVTQWHYATSGRSFSIGFLIALLMLVNPPIWFVSIYALNYGKEHHNDGASFLGDRIKYVSLFFSIVFIGASANGFYRHKDLSIFNEQYIKYMLDNLEKKEVVFTPDIYEGDIVRLRRNRQSVPFVYLPDKDTEQKVSCTLRGERSICKDITDNSNYRNKTFTITYFDHKYISKTTGLEVSEYILFGIEGENHRDIRYYTTVYTSDLKTIRASKIAYFLVVIVTLLFHINLYLKGKKYVIY